MMELDKEIKEKLKEQRLSEYKQKIFVHQMNDEACKAVEDKEGMNTATKHIEALEKAYKAVKEM